MRSDLTVLLVGSCAMISTSLQGASSGAIVRRGNTLLDGRKAPESVEMTVRRGMSAIRSCFQRGLRKNPKLHGHEVFRMKLSQNGSVAKVEIGGIGRIHSNLGKCFIGYVKRWRFPPQGKSVEVHFMFASNNKTIAGLMKHSWRWCPDDTVCFMDGSCTYSNGSCIVASDDDCLRSMECKKFGKCSALKEKNGGKFCGLKYSKFKKRGGCRKSRDCYREGLCTDTFDKKGVFSGCEATSNDDCKNSSMCKIHKECFLDVNSKRCGQISSSRIGVPACDEYVKKFQKCIRSKIPTASRPAMEKGLQVARSAWKMAAETETGRKALSIGCKRAMEVGKKALAAYKCEW